MFWVHHGLALWGLGLVLITLSYPRLWPARPGVDQWFHSGHQSADRLDAGGVHLAVRAFQHERIWRFPNWVVWLPLVLNMAAVIVFLRDDHWRNILVAATQATMGFMLLHEAWAPGLTERRLTGRWVLIGGASILCVTLVCRTVFMALASDWDARYNVPTHVQASTYFVAMAVVLINSMGFVLMQMERSIDQQRSLATHDALTGTTAAPCKTCYPVRGTSATPPSSLWPA